MPTILECGFIKFLLFSCYSFLIMIFRMHIHFSNNFDMILAIEIALLENIYMQIALYRLSRCIYVFGNIYV